LPHARVGSPHHFCKPRLKEFQVATTLMPQSIRPPLVQVVIFVVLLPFVHQLFLNPGILPSTHKTKDVNFLNKLLGNRLQLKPATPNSCAGYIASYTIIIIIIIIITITITITIIIIIIIITITITITIIIIIISISISITIIIIIIIIKQVCMCLARSSGQRILMTLDKACPVLTLLGCCKRHT